MPPQPIAVGAMDASNVSESGPGGRGKVVLDEGLTCHYQPSASLTPLVNALATSPSPQVKRATRKLLHRMPSLRIDGALLFGPLTITAEVAIRR